MMFALVATLPRTTQTARTVLIGIAVGATFLCVGGLLTRILPDVFPIAPNVLDQRLSYPITYWNGVGLLAALAIVFATHFTCSTREHPAARIVGAAVLPLLASTLFFTFSRASIVVMVVGVVLYVVLARPRGFLPACIAVLPPVAIAVIWSYNADLLARSDPTTDAAADQGHEVFVVLLLCVLFAAVVRYALIRTGLDHRIALIDVSKQTRNRIVAIGSAVLLVGTASAWIALDVNDRISRQYDRFREGDVIARRTTPASASRAVGNNGRIAHWEEALDAFGEEPLEGTGAGTYELTWAEHRSTDFTVRDGHSLYLETLSELGIVGAILLVGDPWRDPGRPRLARPRAPPRPLGGDVHRRLRVGVTRSAGLGLGAAVGDRLALRRRRDRAGQAAGGTGNPARRAAAARAGDRRARRAGARGHARAERSGGCAPARQRHGVQARRLPGGDRSRALGHLRARGAT